MLPGGQEDLVLNLDISDQIRSKKINAKDAMRSFKKRLAHKNPNVQLATISVSWAHLYCQANTKLRNTILIACGYLR
jgi:hypothetical protein